MTVILAPGERSELAVAGLTLARVARLKIEHFFA